MESCFVSGLYLKFTENEDAPLILDVGSKIDDRYKFEIVGIDDDDDDDHNNDDDDDDDDDASCHFEHHT